MQKEIISEKYAGLSIEELLNLSADINELQPEAIPLLTFELSSRGEHEEVLRITKHLSSEKYKISEDYILTHILKLRDDGLSEIEIDKHLIENYHFDQVFVELIRSKLIMRGKGNLFIGIPFILIPLFFGLLAYYNNISLTEGWNLIVGLLAMSALLVTGISYVNKGIKEIKHGKIAK